jgi:hypothetical protein
MDFSTSAFESATPADGVGLGGGEAGASDTSRPSMALDVGGMLLAILEAETSKLGALPAKAWPYRLSAFHGASGGTSNWTLMQERQVLALKPSCKQTIHKGTPYLCIIGWGLFVMARLGLTPLSRGRASSRPPRSRPCRAEKVAAVTPPSPRIMIPLSPQDGPTPMASGAPLLRPSSPLPQDRGPLIHGTMGQPTATAPRSKGTTPGLLPLLSHGV